MNSAFWTGYTIGVFIGALIVVLYKRWQHFRRYPRIPMEDLKRMATLYNLKVFPGESRQSLYERIRAHLKMGPRA